MHRTVKWMLVLVLGCFGESSASPRSEGPADHYANSWQHGRDQPRLENAHRLWEAARRKSPDEIASILTLIAQSRTKYTDGGQHHRAEPLYQLALTIQEAVHGSNHPQVAKSLEKLAVFYREQGAYSQAEAFYLRALAIHEATGRRGDFILVDSLTALADIYKEQGMHARAEAFSLRARSARMALLSQRNSHRLPELVPLANLYRVEGLYAQASLLYQHAIARDNRFAPKEGPYGLANHPERLSPDQLEDSLDGLATLYFEQGLHEQAAAVYQRLILLADQHEEIDALHNLAAIRLAQHRLTEALPLLTRAFALSEQLLSRQAVETSNPSLFSILPRVRAHEEMLYALLRAHRTDARVRRLALGAALSRKGRSIEETAALFRSIAHDLPASDHDTFERLRRIRAQRAALALAGPGPLRPLEYQLRLIALDEADGALESILARRSARMREFLAPPSADQMVDNVASQLPRHGALIEFIAYMDKPFVPRPHRLDGGTSRTRGPLHYLALVLFPDASTQAVDLGPAEPIDRAAARLRDALAQGSASVQADAQALHERVFQPLRPLLGSTRRILLSPDGQLGLVPFSALHDGQDYLVDTFDFIYLTSGRELLPRKWKQTPTSSVFVLADPDFSAASRPPPTAYRSSALERFFSSASDLPRSDWVPLPGTRGEARSIQRLFPRARLFLGAKATKEQLGRLPTPGILHVATHGFFLGSAVSTHGERGVVSFGLQSNLPPPQREPLLNSGLVLAGGGATTSGANSARSDASLVTALELAGLNLRGC